MRLERLIKLLGPMLALILALPVIVDANGNGEIAEFSKQSVAVSPGQVEFSIQLRLTVQEAFSSAEFGIKLSDGLTLLDVNYGDLDSESTVAPLYKNGVYYFGFFDYIDRHAGSLTIAVMTIGYEGDAPESVTWTELHLTRFKEDRLPLKQSLEPGVVTSVTREEPEATDSPDAEPTSTPTLTPTPTPTVVPIPPDVNNHWASDAVQRLADLGALQVNESGLFNPEQGASRGGFIDLLVRAIGLKSDQDQGEDVFTDTEGHWAGDSIRIAQQWGIVQGYSDSSFGPDDDITREQMAVILIRALGLERTPITEEWPGAGFTDNSEASPWAQDALRITRKLGLLNGFPDGSFRPQQVLTRAEMAVIAVRILDYLEADQA